MSEIKKMLVLAGGAGSRLKPVVSDVPKTLAPAEGKPFIHFLLEQWIAQSIHDFTFLLHYEAQKIIGYLEDEQKNGLLQDCRVSHVVEPKPLGTGGAVAHALKTLGITDSFLLANSDTWLGSGITELARSTPPCIGVIGVANSGRYGTVSIRGDKITAFTEKTSKNEAGLINAGIYHLTPVLFHEWDGRAFSLENEALPQLVARGELHALTLDTEFIDIGIPEDYLRFCHWIHSKKSCPL